MAALALRTVLGPPTVVTPYPALVPIAAFAVGYPAFLLPAILFWCWSPQLFKGGVSVPRRSAVPFGLLTALTPPYFIAGWEYGIRYDGRHYVVGAALMNLAVILLLWIRLFRARSHPSFHASFAFHGLLFGWLAWCAFPNLGELP